MKKTIHVWAGQAGTMCSLSHIKEEDDFVWISKMESSASIQVNCKKCLREYTNYRMKEKLISSSVKPNHPLAEILAKKLFGIEIAPKKEQTKMVNRAIKAAVEWAISIEEKAWMYDDLCK